MLGWHLIVYRERGKGSVEDKDTIAHWTTGLGGTAWINRLVEEGLASKIASNGGYPLKYIGKAKDILPSLTSKPTQDGSEDNSAKPTRGGRSITIDEGLAAGCLQRNEAIIVDAWDQS